LSPSYSVAIVLDEEKENFSKDYYGLEGFEISVIFEKFFVCSFDQSGLRVYWQTLECTVMKNEYTELDFQVHKVL